MICPICGNDSLIRNGSEVICISCKAQGTCDVSDIPVKSKDVLVNVALFDQHNQYVKTIFHRGLSKIDLKGKL